MTWHDTGIILSTRKPHCILSFDRTIPYSWIVRCSIKIVKDNIFFFCTVPLINFIDFFGMSWSLVKFVETVEHICIWQWVERMKWYNFFIIIKWNEVYKWFISIWKKSFFEEKKKFYKWCFGIMLSLIIVMIKFIVKI
jgi:hypothetical protein